MSRQEIKQQYDAIEQQSAQQRQALFNNMLACRVYPDGSRMRRVIHRADGAVDEQVTGVIVGADVFIYEGYPNIQYWVRVETPDSYNSRQRCLKYNLQTGKAQDFWQTDGRWTLVVSDKE